MKPSFEDCENQTAGSFLPQLRNAEVVLFEQRSFAGIEFVPRQRATVVGLQKDMRTRATKDFEMVSLGDEGGALFDGETPHVDADIRAAGEVVEFGVVTQQAGEAFEAAAAGVEMLFDDRLIEEAESVCGDRGCGAIVVFVFVPERHDLWLGGGAG